MKTSPHHTAPARLPAILVPAGGDPQLRQALEAIKERLEVREGSRGNPYERAATMRDLDALQARLASAPSVGAAAAEPETGPAQSVNLRALVDEAVGASTQRMRSEIDARERRLSEQIASLSLGARSGGVSAAEAQARGGKGVAYTYDNLASDLASGGALILSGAVDGTTVMELDPAGQYVLFKHRLASPTAVPGAGYSGPLRQGVGITAAGFIAGYNRRSDNAWQTSIAMDAGTGDVTILGTLKAGSVIEVGTLVGPGGKTLGQLDTNATNALTVSSQAQAQAAAAQSAVAGKLSDTSSYVLYGSVFLTETGGIRAGTISWDSGGNVTSGTGIALNGRGIVGAKNGAPTFTLTNSGDATFSGQITGGANINISGQAYFAGNSSGAVGVYVAGAVRSLQYSAWGAAIGGGAGAVRAGMVGHAASDPAFRSVGVVGLGAGSNGIGVVGDGTLVGGYFTCSTGAQAAIEAYHPSGASGVGISNNGGHRWGNYQYSPPTGTGTRFLRDDGTWSSASGGGGNADSLGGFPASNWTRYINTNSGVALASSQGLQLIGSTSTGIPDAYVGTSASGDLVIFSIRTTSPSDIRLKQNIVDTPLGLAFLRQLRPVEYTLKADATQMKGYGFIAQEVEALGVAGSALVYDDPEYQTGNVRGHKVIHYPSYVAILTKAVQELAARLETLENAP